jgi:hypothetical protein
MTSEGEADLRCHRGVACQPPAPPQVDPGHTRRAARPQAPPVEVGLEVPQASIAVAYVAQAHGAAVVLLGAIGTRQRALAPRLRKLPAKAPPSSVLMRRAPGALGAPAI